MRSENALKHTQGVPMNDKNTLSPWVKRFLVEYLVSVKNLSRNTQHSYRDTFRLYLAHLAKKVDKHID